jgi:geranylgeranyl diphosphate synthase, type II
VNASEPPGSVRESPGEPAYLREERTRVDQTLQEMVPNLCRRLAAPLREPVEYALTAPGKRLRPILCIAAYASSQSEGHPPPSLLRLACALEIVHTYSLVHDDLPCMDDDDLRRGRPTVHRVFGTARATLAGATLLPAAMEVLDAEGAALGLNAPERSSLVRELAAASGAEGMVGGQLLDLSAEQRHVEPGELETIHRCKTGALLTSSLRIGAMAGRAPGELLQALTTYGRAIGLAFQITDDLLDVMGSSAALGKTARRDIALRKASYPSLFGIEQARELARASVEEAKGALRGYHLPRLVSLADFVVFRSN